MTAISMSGAAVRNYRIGWNFSGKFIVDPDGNVSATNSPQVDIARLVR